MQKIKRLLAIILIAVLTVTQLPVTAMAEDVAEDEIGSAEELKAALDKVANGSWDTHTLKLTDDINYRHPILMTGGRDVTIDLNGHTLTVQPDSMAEPNINPMSNKPEIAAVYVHFGSLNITGTGELNVVAEDGVNYGVYAGEGGSCGSFGEFGDPSHDFDVTVTSTGGGTGVYATDGGTVGLYGSVSADGENAYAIECFDGGNVRIDGQITANGKSSCGVSMASYNGKSTYAGGWAHIDVSGESSRGAYVNGEGTWFSIMGDVTVTGDGASGVTAGGGDPSDYTTECIVYIGAVSPLRLME